MEDKHIFKGELCYSVRIDGPHNPTDEQMVLEKLKEFFTRACVAREHKKDGTPHFQAVAWRTQKLTSAQNTTMRTYFKQKFNYTYNNAVSIISARKIESLAKYCNDKEKKGTMSFGISDLTILGQWENKETIMEKLKDKYIALLKQHKGTEIIEINLLCKLACQVYQDVRPPPFKSLLQYGRSSGYLTQDAFQREYYPSFQGHNTYERNPYKNVNPPLEENSIFYPGL